MFYAIPPLPPPVTQCLRKLARSFGATTKAGRLQVLCSQKIKSHVNCILGSMSVVNLFSLIFSESIKIYKTFTILVQTDNPYTLASLFLPKL